LGPAGVAGENPDRYGPSGGRLTVARVSLAESGA
jgi:hypothetical protein